MQQESWEHEFCSDIHIYRGTPTLTLPYSTVDVLKNTEIDKCNMIQIMVLKSSYSCSMTI
jgi:hypothetical protein